MTAALPKEEAPRCDECKRPKLTWTTLPGACVGPGSHCARELVPRDGDQAAACHRIARDLSRAAHQKTLDALAEMIGTPRMGTGLVFQARLMAKSAIDYAANKEPGDNLYVNAKDTLAEADRLYAIGQAALRAGGRNV